jgi:hypothetical protein
MRADAVRARDYGLAGTAVSAAAALAFGLLIAAFVFWEGRDHLRLHLDLFGARPMLIDDLPWLLTATLTALVLGVAGFMAWVIRCGGLDRPALALLAFAMVADAIPAVTQVAIALVLVVLVRRILRDGDVHAPLTPLAIPLLVVIISYATSFLVVENYMSLIGTFLFRLTSNMLIVVLLPALLRTRRQIETFFHMLLACACISVGVEWVQWGLSAVAGVPITFNTGSYDKVATPWGVFPRLTGLMYHPNLQSNCISTIAVLTLWFGLRPRGAMPAARRTLYLAAYVWLTLGVLFTWSRSGWLSLGIASLLVPIVRYPRFAPVYVGTLGALGAVAWQTGALKALYEFVENLNKASADFRWHIDQLAVEAFSSHPWLGLGTMGILDYDNPWKLQVHDTYLQIAAEMGIVGIFSFALFGVIVLSRMLWTLFHSKFAFDRDWILGLLVASTVALIQNSFVMFLWVRFLWLLMPLAECIHLAARNQDGEEPEDLAFLPPRAHPQPA